MTGKSLQLGLLQYAIVADDPQANLRYCERLLPGLFACDLIVLPEVFTTGFSASARQFAEAPDGPVHQWLAEQAAQLNAVITGSLVVREKVQGETRHFNRMIWMRPDGTYSQYDKRHLFRMAGEHQRYTGGTQRLIVELNGWRVMPLVCYDLRFPVWSRNRNDYDLCLYVANWPAARALHWNRLLQARAIENLAYVAGVNRIGKDAQGQHYAGDSTVFAPNGEPLLQAGSAAGAFVTTLDWQRLQDYRTSFPAHLDADDFQLF